MKSGGDGTVIVFTTGGTIASTHDSLRGGLACGDVVPKLLERHGDRLRMIELANVPSTAVTLAMLAAWAERIDAELESADVVGAVVTTGTNGLEETAFYLDLAVRSEKPLVLTGSMNTFGNAMFDGEVNLDSALQLVRSGAVTGLGTVVVMNDQIHASRFIRKVDANNVHAFASPLTGPIGYLVPHSHGKRVRILSHPAPWRLVPEQEPRDSDLRRSGREPKVWIISSYLGAGNEQIEAAIACKVDGIVIEGFPSGEITPPMSQGILNALSKGIPVVTTCRAAGGELTDLYAGDGEGVWLRDVGVISAAGLTAFQARVCMYIVLRNGHDLQRTMTQALS